MWQGYQEQNEVKQKAKEKSSKLWRKNKKWAVMRKQRRERR